jgi:large subunit ribosomal protein L17
MQHNRAGRKLGRTTAHRRALFRNQLASLFTHERITTTLYKAKDLRPLAEKMVTLGKRGGLHARRLALRQLPDAGAVGRLFDDIAPRFAGRPGGYTRILKLGRRPGDGAEMAILEFTDFDYAQRLAEKKVAEKAAADKKESLLEKARKLVTGKGKSEKKEGEAEKPEAEVKEAKAAKAEPKAAEAEVTEKKPRVKRERVQAPKVKGEKRGGTHGGGPRKTGGG